MPLGVNWHDKKGNACKPKHRFDNQKVQVMATAFSACKSLSSFFSNSCLRLQSAPREQFPTVCPTSSIGITFSFTGPTLDASSRFSILRQRLFLTLTCCSRNQITFSFTCRVIEHTCDEGVSHNRTRESKKAETHPAGHEKPKRLLKRRHELKSHSIVT